MEKRIKVSTQGRLAIPKQLRDVHGIRAGQPIIVRSGSSKREIVIEILPEITDFK
ncbi:MAG: hypothetical protein ACYC7D_09265 [Nitrososphaerales archaeon]